MANELTPYQLYRQEYGLDSPTQPAPVKAQSVKPQVKEPEAIQEKSELTPYQKYRIENGLDKPVNYETVQEPSLVDKSISYVKDKIAQIPSLVPESYKKFKEDQQKAIVSNDRYISGAGPMGTTLDTQPSEKPQIEFEKIVPEAVKQQYRKLPTPVQNFGKGAMDVVEGLSSPKSLQTVVALAPLAGAAPKLASAVLGPMISYEAATKGTEAYLEGDWRKAGQAGAYATMLATPYLAKKGKLFAKETVSKVVETAKDIGKRSSTIKDLQSKGYEFYGNRPKGNGEIWIKKDPKTGGVVDQTYVSKQGIVSKLTGLIKDVFKQKPKPDTSAKLLTEPKTEAKAQGQQEPIIPLTVRTYEEAAALGAQKNPVPTPQQYAPVIAPQAPYAPVVAPTPTTGPVLQGEVKPTNQPTQKEIAQRTVNDLAGTIQYKGTVYKGRSQDIEKLHMAAAQANIKAEIGKDGKVRLVDLETGKKITSKKTQFNKPVENPALIESLSPESRDFVNKVAQDVGGDLDTNQLNRSQAKAAAEDIKHDKGREASLRAQIYMDEVLAFEKTGGVGIKNSGVQGVGTERAFIPREELLQKPKDSTPDSVAPENPDTSFNIEEFEKQSAIEQQRQQNKLLAEQGMENLQKPRPDQKPVDEGLFDNEQALFSKFSGGQRADLYKREMPVSMEPAPNFKTKQAPVGAYDIVQKIGKIWNAPIGIGKFKQGTKGGVRTGVFYPKSGQVRLGTANDIPTATHEIAHWFDSSTPVKGFRRKYAQELGPLDYNPTRGNTAEGFAEFIRHYLTNNTRAQDLAPMFYKAFNEFLELNPKIKKNMSDTAALIKTFKDQGATRRAEGMVGKMGEEGQKSHLSTWNRIKLGWRTAMTDELAVLDYAVRDMAGKKAISPSKDPYKLAMYSKGSGSRAKAFLVNESVDFSGLKTGESLKEVFNLVDKKDFNDFLTFAYSRIALERLGQNRNPGISKKDAQYIFDTMKDRPNFMDASTRFSDWYGRLLDYAFEPMFKNRESYLKIKNSTAFYLPLRRIIDNAFGPSGSGSGTYMMPGEGVKRMSETGSGRKVKNFVQQAINMAEQMVEIADKSRVVYALRDLGMSSPKGKWWIRKVDRPMEADSLSLRKIRDALKKEFGYDLYDPETDSIVGEIGSEKMEELKGISEDTEIPLKDLIREETSEALDVMSTFFSNASFAKKGSNLIALPEADGKVTFYEMDPMLYNSLNGMNNIELSGWLKWLDAIPFAAKKTVVLGATGLKFSWAFINALRDTMMSVVTSQKPGIGAAGRHVKAYGDVFMNTPEYRQWRNTGGEMANLVRENQRQLKTVYDELMTRSKKDKLRNVIKHPIEYTKSVISVSETATRLGEFKLIKDKLEKAGYGPEDVAVEASTGASDVSLNFKRMGSIVKYLNRYIPYINPFVQGKSKTYRTFTGPNKFKSMAAAFKYITIPAIGLYLMSRDNDKMEERDWYERLTSLPVSFSDKGYLWKLPIPQDEIGIIFGSMPLAILESYDRQDRSILDGVVKQYFNQAVLPPMLPAVAMGAAEWSANKSFFRNRPLEPKWMDDQSRGILPGYRTNEYTFDIIKDIGEALNISPIKIQNTLAVQTGGLGSEAMQLANILQGNAKELADYPLLSRLVTRENKAGKSVSEYFDKMGELQQIKNTADYKMKQNDYDYGTKEKIENKYNFELSDYYELDAYKDMILDALKAKDYRGATDLARQALGKDKR